MATGRVWLQVIAKTGTVKAEPHMEAKLKTKKSKGSRFIVSEMSMNGWLKLENEPGWIAARPVSGPASSFFKGIFTIFH